ncbi:hypothetical protein LSAT2_011284 [Lamellibrachia satsuma]|nr:hypothetical protein LSAT2_011284 [Lamellibrachia satsuma]
MHRENSTYVKATTSGETSRNNTTDIVSTKSDSADTLDIDFPQSRRWSSLDIDGVHSGRSRSSFVSPSPPDAILAEVTESRATCPDILRKSVGSTPLNTWIKTIALFVLLLLLLVLLTLIYYDHNKARQVISTSENRTDATTAHSTPVSDNKTTEIPSNTTTTAGVQSTTMNGDYSDLCACEHGGSCIESSDMYEMDQECVCLPGFRGPNCEYIVENSANVKLFAVLILSLLILVIVTIRYQWKKDERQKRDRANMKKFRKRTRLVTFDPTLSYIYHLNDDNGAARDAGGEEEKTLEGSKTEIREGSKTDIREGSKTEIREGSKTDIREGNKSEIGEGSKTDIREGSKSEIGEGSKTKTRCHEPSTNKARMRRKSILRNPTLKFRVKHVPIKVDDDIFINLT